MTKNGKESGESSEVTSYSDPLTAGGNGGLDQPSHFSHFSTRSQPTEPFNTEELEALRKLLQSKSAATVVGTGSLAQTGNFIHALSAKQEKEKLWIIDSGASDHMTGHKSMFKSYVPCNKNFHVRIADGSLSRVAGTGFVEVSKYLTLKEVLFVPNLNCNLLSMHKFTLDNNCKANIYPHVCEFQDLVSGKMIGSARSQDGLYYLQAQPDPMRQFTPSAVSENTPSHTFTSIKEPKIGNDCDKLAMLWHYRLGHPNFIYLSKLFPKFFRNKSPLSLQCEICQLSKHTRMHYPIQSYKSSKPFSMIHSDVWGPSKIPNVTGARWFITFIDDHTRLTWIFLMKNKSEVSQIFKTFKIMIHNQFKTQIQILRTDNGREFFNSNLGNYLSSEGIIHQSSCVDTPQQNGIAERKNRQLLEIARSLLFSSRAPKHLWGEAVLTAAYLTNRLPSKVLNFSTPNQILLKFYPNCRLISNLPPKIFGCTAFIHIHNHNRSKLDPRSTKCVFVGYSPTQKGYKCFCPHTHKFFHTMDITFFESTPYFSETAIQGENSTSHSNPHYLKEYQFLEDDMQPSPSMPSNLPTATKPANPSPTANVPEIIVYQRKQGEQRESEDPALTEVSQDSEPETQSLDSHLQTVVESPTGESTSKSGSMDDESDFPIAIRKGVRECRSRPLYPISNYVSYEGLSPTYQAFIANISTITIPSSIHEALIVPEWKAAIEEEVKALQKNGTWEITELPSGKTPIGCKWIFTVKTRADGNIDRYKARLVAKGFTQSYGIDYQETFAPVAKLNTIRVLLSLAANLDWPLHQLDVKNAFLNGNLEEEVYLEIPQGLESPTNRNKVCKLKKSLYGLKQSPRAWFERFTKVLKNHGYTQGQADHTMFVKRSPNDRLAILIVYVDDIVITGDYLEEIPRVKEFLAREFEIKDLGNLKYFLGMEIARSRKGIAVSQRKYVLDLLKETAMQDCKPAETPMDYTTKLGSNKESAPVEKGRYQRLVGKLIYLSHTRPDIAFPVSVVSQFMNNPTEEHMTAVYRILRYLKMTPGKGLLFRKTTKREVELYSDADWAGSITDRRSTSGYCTYVWGNLTTWRSKKQAVVARSSAEAEFRAMAHGICEGIWLKRLLAELQITSLNSIKLFCDSQAAISIAKDPVHHDRTKHVEIDRHFIKEKIDGGIIKLIYTPSALQIADILTKALPRTIFEDLSCKLSMVNIYNPT